MKYLNKGLKMKTSLKCWKRLKNNKKLSYDLCVLINKDSYVHTVISLSLHNVQPKSIQSKSNLLIFQAKCLSVSNRRPESICTLAN